MDRRRRGDGYDAAAGFLQARQSYLHYPEDAGQVDREHRAPLLRRNVQNMVAAIDPSVANDAVQPAHRAVGMLHERRGSISVRRVIDERMRAGSDLRLSDGGGETGLVTIGEHHMRTFFDQSQRARATDAARRASHENASSLGSRLFQTIPPRVACYSTPRSERWHHSFGRCRTPPRLRGSAASEPAAGRDRDQWTFR